METKPKVSPDALPFDLGREGETQFERLRTALEYGQGFELFFCGFQTAGALAEVRRRLAEAPPSGNEFEALTLAPPDQLEMLPERLAVVHPAAEGRKIVFVAAPGMEETLRAQWTLALRRFNERRNTTMRECPNAVVLAGPSWLPWVAHDIAPDLWSIRTALFEFLSPPSPDWSDSLRPQIEPWRSGLPMPHELESPNYYEKLAAALESSRRPEEQETRNRLLLYASAAWKLRGDLDAAMRTARMAAEGFQSIGDDGRNAAAKGYMADILVQRGELDEAMRILQEEVLPVFKELGEEHARTVAMGSVADILQKRGELEEALRILMETELPFYEKMGDKRSWAATWGRIADLLSESGQLDEALRVLREIVAPGFDNNDDRLLHAATMGQIADILQQRGELAEALRIRREEQLPVYERLGDVRLRAITMGKIAEIFRLRGELAEALRLLKEEVLPIFSQLGDIRSYAVTMGDIADILQKRGEFDEALRIRREEELPVYERLGDARSRAIAMGQIADILRRRGEFDEALRMVREEVLPSIERMGDLEGIATTQLFHGIVLAERGDHDKALQVLAIAAATFEKLKMTDEVAKVHAVQEQIRRAMDPK